MRPSYHTAAKKSGGFAARRPVNTAHNAVRIGVTLFASGIGTIIGVILVSLPLALFLNVVLMMISIRTKTFKYAQSAITPIVLAVMVPALATAFVPPKGPLAFLVPIYGPSAVVSILATGGTMPDGAIILSTIGSLVAAMVCIVFALRLFNRERLLYSM